MYSDIPPLNGKEQSFLKVLLSKNVFYFSSRFYNTSYFNKFLEPFCLLIALGIQDYFFFLPALQKELEIPPWCSSNKENISSVTGSKIS